jgi:hypothetical protein
VITTYQLAPSRHGHEDPAALELVPVPDGQLVPGFTPYNPGAAAGALAEARQKLHNCFWARAGDGTLRPDQYGLDDHNGKSRADFKSDLYDLAVLGNALFNQVTGQVNTGDANISAASWTRRLRRALADAAVIQVARTVSAEYVFPWALVYEYPMPGPRYRDCTILDEEWNANGRRQTAELRTRCRYSDESWHLENVYCPYGFWGLKHIVEQPPSILERADGRWRLRNVQSTIVIGQNVDIAVGVTRDANVDSAGLGEHLSQLGQIQSLRFVPPSPADEITAVRTSLVSPQVVYFLCHGEVDAQGRPYLGIGPRDNAITHQIYPATVQDWATTLANPNLSAWEGQHPLVFINGCHTCNLKPDEMLNFVTAFSLAEASGVIGTEVSIELAVATEVGQSMLTLIAQGVPAGEALYRVRWDLVNKGNLIGLAYTLYGMADLRLVRDG